MSINRTGCGLYENNAFLSKISLNFFFNYVFFLRLFAKLACRPLNFPIKIN